jgi:hypothetical protein
MIPLMHGYRKRDGASPIILIPMEKKSLKKVRSIPSEKGKEKTAVWRHYLCTLTAVTTASAIFFALGAILSQLDELPMTGDKKLITPVSDSARYQARRARREQRMKKRASQ